MTESGPGSGRRAFGDLTNVLGKRSAPPPDLEKNVEGNKVGRVAESQSFSKNTVGLKKESNENANASGSFTGREFGGLFDGARKENFVRPSIFRGSKVQQMAAEAAGRLAKEVDEPRSNHESLDSSELNDKEQESSLETGDSEEEDETDSELLTYTRKSSMDHFGNLELADRIASKEKADDGECLTQEQTVELSGNHKPMCSLDLTMGGGVACPNVQNAPMGNGGLEEADAAFGKSCACSFCLKAAFMLADLHYQDARGRFAALKKSRKNAGLLEAKSHGNEYIVSAARYNSKQAAEMEFELAQQQRSLFLYTENILVRETAQLHSALVKLKELKENCKRDLQTVGNSSLEK